MTGLMDHTGNEEKTSAHDCVMFLREFAEFLDNGSPQSERPLVSVITLALEQTANFIEMGDIVIAEMSEEMRRTLSAGVFDEDRYLSVLARWKEYDRGL